MAETVEVDAVLIDSDIQKMPAADKWLAGLDGRVNGICGQYGKPEKMTVGDRRKARADLNKALKTIKSERTEMLKSLKESIKRFESESNGKFKPLDDLIATFDAAVKADESAWRDARRAELEGMYAELAPDLVDRVDPDTGEIEPALVPFDKLLAKYGNEKGAVWLNKTTNIQIVRMSMQNAVYDIGEGEKAIDSMVPEEDRNNVKARYFDTLDIDLTMAEAKRLKEHRECIKAMEFARQVSYSAMPTPEPVPEPTPEPAQEQEPKEVGPHAWVISVPSATREQMNMVADFMRKNGIGFDRIYSGTVEDAFRKEAFGE